MTREEKMWEAVAQEHGDLSMRDALVTLTAMEWADKTMIEKACQWITEHIDIPYEGEFIDDSPVASDYIEWCKKRLEYAKAIADAFKQAMEE